MRIPVRMPRVRRAGGWGLPGPRIRRPASVAPEAFNDTVRVPIGGRGVAQGIVSAAGIATVSIGPDGQDRWYPSTATMQTSSGPGDGSESALFWGVVSDGTLLNGVTYAGNASAGLAIPVMMPGDLLVCEWALAHPTDYVTLRVIGELEAAVPWQGGDQ
jgi:hypothetical protein